ncbi:hypothetical protein CCR85_00805 [Rhodothalassium salexigens]|uniref:alpha/beta hydrolase n=1 Tax=Rhodothalassium salexigens TaxID=1086 RepID=UPI0019139DCC|nr:hypothetical protein [Rhodothalassium salexigens]MBK5910033.1 hypothetical protein [Rhodothalassium salexigens]
MDSPTSPLTGPEIVPDTVDSLVILAHGYGSNGQDLHGLAQQMAPHLQRTAFLSPNAPEPCPGAPGGYQWFGLSRLDPTERDTGVIKAGPTLDRFVTDSLARFDLDDRRLVLAGFSQGTMMALHVGLRRTTEPAGILGFSGCLGAPAALRHEIQSRPPVFLIHGTHDEVLPFPLMFEAKGALEANGVTVRHHLSQNVPHSIGADGLAQGLDFLTEVLS